MPLPRYEDMTIEHLRERIAAGHRADLDVRNALAELVERVRAKKAALEIEYSNLSGKTITLAEAATKYDVPAIWLHKQLQAGRLRGERLGAGAGGGNSNRLDAAEVAVIVGLRHYMQSKELLVPGSRLIEMVYRQPVAA